MTYPVTRFGLRLLAASVGLIAAAPAPGQLLPDAPVAMNQNDAGPGATAAPPSASIPDSPAAMEKFSNAREKENQKEWKTAAEFYQEVLTKYSRRVVPQKIDKTAGIYQYAGVAQLVQERLAKWPDNGLNVYRAVYGQTAAELLSSAARDDSAAIANVFWTYFITDAGKAAGIRLMDNALEAGQFESAAWIGERLLSLHPLLGADRAMVVFRTALARHWAGDGAAAQGLLDDLKQHHINDTGSIGGKDVVLVDALAEAMSAPAPMPATQPSDADHWPAFGGPGGRGEISSSLAKPGAQGLAPIQLAPPALDELNAQPQQRPSYLQLDQEDLQAGQLLGVMPATDAGALFFQDGRHIYAVNADSGQPLPGWLHTYPTDHGRYGIKAFGRARGEQLTITVTANQVLAVMGQADHSSLAMGIGLTGTPTRLICLDRTTGRELWSRSPADLPESAAPVRNSDYNGAPLVIDDGKAGSVLIMARGGKGNQFEDCYVVSLSLANGAYQWSTYIGSASQMMEGEIGGGSQVTAQLSWADGRVFVLSNIGEAASIDPYDGRMIWLNCYPRDASDNPENPAMLWRNRMNASGRPTAAKPWTPNPVVVARGKVFVLPSDGRHLLIYDAGNGAELKRITTADYDSINVLLGVRDKWLVATSDNGTFCIDWSKYDHDDPEAAIVWKSMLAGGNAVAGRGFLTADSVFVPSQQRLYQIGFNRSGRLLDTYPPQGAWASGDGPGNVVVTSQNIIVAGSTQVNVYTDISLVRRRYEKEIAAAPQAIEPRVTFAGVLFAAGQTQAAMQKMDEAIDLLGGVHSMRNGKERGMIFTRLLDFAEKTGAGSNQGSDIAEQLFDRASSAADSAGEKAIYRLTRAKRDHENQKFAAEVKLCQEILSDEAMRTVSVSDNSIAGTLAAAAIANAMQIDRASYDEVEKSAAAALEAARADGNPDRLLNVATVYPNSKAAIEARQAAATRFEVSGNHAAAIETLRQWYTAIGDGPVKSTLLEAVARNYLAMPGGVGPALDRLARGARTASEPRLSQPMPLPDGTTLRNVSFADAVAALRRLKAAEDSQGLPDFHIMVRANRKDKPFVSMDGPIIPGVAALLRPATEFSRNDRIITWSPGGLSVFAVAEITPLATAHHVSEQPLGVAWAGKTLIAWTSDQVTLLSENGSAAWKTDVHALPLIAVASDADAILDQPAEGNAVDTGMQQLVLNGGQARILVRNGRQFIVQPGGVVRQIGFVANAPGQAAPAAVVAGAVEQITTVRPAGARLIVGTSNGRLLGLDLSSGSIVWQTRLAEGPINQILANPHYTVARLDDSAGSQLVVADTITGEIIGRRKFAPQNTPNQLINVALSEEGTIAYTVMNRLFVKDLYEPWKSAPTELTGKPNTDATNFTGLNQSDQLLIQGGRVLALYDGGKFVRVHDLAGAAAAGNPLATGADSVNVSIRVVGPRLFIVHGQKMTQYNLENEGDHYPATPYDVDYQPRIRELMLGRDYALLVNQPADHGPANPHLANLLAYRRSPVSPTNPRESGLLDYMPAIESSAGIVDWQPVDGGVYYLTGDQKLHFLAGSRK